jgi:uncharacterized protein YehS (DUF1456 family)
MKPSEIIQAIKEALSLNRAQIKHIYELEEFYIDDNRLNSILKNPSKKGAKNATYEELGVFLDGLISYKRGKSNTKANEDEEIILDNNLILKKLRIALNLKEFELALIFELVDYNISKSTLKDMFRSPNHPKLKECDNKTLKAFLDGLNEFYYDSQEYL